VGLGLRAPMRVSYVRSGKAFGEENCRSAAWLRRIEELFDRGKPWYLVTTQGLHKVTDMNPKHMQLSLQINLTSAPP